MSPNDYNCDHTFITTVEDVVVPSDDGTFQIPVTIKYCTKCAWIDDVDWKN